MVNIAFHCTCLYQLCTHVVQTNVPNIASIATNGYVHRIFALPSSKKSKVIIKTKNKIKKIQINKDDCIDNFFKLVFNRIKKKKYEIFYNMILKDAKVRNLISNISK